VALTNKEIDSLFFKKYGFEEMTDKQKRALKEFTIYYVFIFNIAINELKDTIYNVLSDYFKRIVISYKKKK